MTQYLIPFLTSFLASVGFIFLGIYFGRKIKWRDRKSDRHIHRPEAMRIGGVAMILAFNLSILLNRDLFISSSLYGVMAASLVLLVIGVWDDIKEIFWKTQFLFQVAAVILVFIFGVRIYYITNPLTGGIIHLDSGIGIVFSIFLVSIWIIIMVNSMNWVDGIDGLSGGITFIGALTIFFLSLKPEVNQPPMAILCMILAGSALGFLIFNFNPSRVLAGTAGSTFMGFALASLAIFAGTKIATSILVMSIPLVDFLWVVGERLKKEQSIFKPDSGHFHYKLLNLGWSQRKIAVFFYAMTAILALLALNTRVFGKTLTLAIASLIIIAVLIFVNKKISIFEGRLKKNKQ